MPVLTARGKKLALPLLSAGVRSGGGHRLSEFVSFSKEGSLVC